VPDTPVVRLAPAPDTTPTVEALRDQPTARRPTSLTAPVEPLLLTADQAAALCGVSGATWYRMASAGRCPASVRLSRGCVRWRRDELTDWIAAGCPDRKTWEALKATGNANGRRGTGR
jgi:predicted DNA-binding transcriptional regulator AlpA